MLRLPDTPGRWRLPWRRPGAADAGWPPAPSARPRPPGQCEVCRAWSPAPLCDGCSGRADAPAPRCRRCALRVGSFALPQCGECLRAPPPFERTVCGADYVFPWQRLIGEFKFDGRVELAAALAQCLHDALRREAVGGAARRPDLLLPMPLHEERLRERGYNQAWEIARRLARSTGCPADPTLLWRPLPGVAQATLPRAERLAHLRGAFMVEPRRRAEIAGLRIALVDDVLTTGATAREAAATLLRAGAAAVDVWVVARTP